MEDILINCSPRETRVAILENGSLEELHIERDCARGLVGNIYKGRVVRVIPGLQSAFVDIGLERTAFLHVADIWESRRSGTGEMIPIEKLLHPSDSILVQVIKDPISTKGARLSTQISLAGRMLVYLPQDAHVGVSQKIENEDERARLRELVASNIPRGLEGGFIVRTCAEGAGPEDVCDDMLYLARGWKHLSQIASQAPTPSLLYEDLSLAERTLRDLVRDETESIVIDNRSAFNALLDFAQRLIPDVAGRLKLYCGERPLFEQFALEEEIERSLCRRVDLKSGGYLIFDQTEAMSTIDVNTGGFVGRRNFGETVFKTNLEAAQTIARQLRLRNLGGIIIVDFIDMASDEDRAAVLNELRRATERDRTRMTISNFTELGLVEMTRKRTRESLAHVLCEPCPICGGRGEIKTARTICYQILREVLHEWRQYKNAREFRIIANQAVIDLFLEEENAALELLSDSIDKPVSLQVESSYDQEQYDIILG